MIMKIIDITVDNIEKEHICCAIGNDKANQEKAALKKNWLKKCFKDGLVFKRLDERGKIFIEYIPIEKAWKPITGKNFLVINCLWVAGRFQGKKLGKALLDECIADAKQQKKSGICVVVGKKKQPFLTDKKFYAKYGFQVCDTAEPYFELMVLTFNKSKDLPKFTKNAQQGILANKKDFSLVYSNQCPFTEEYAGIMSEVVKNKGKTFEIIKLESAKQAQKLGSPFGTFGVYYKGRFILHEIMPEKKFDKFLVTIL